MLTSSAGRMAYPHHPANPQPSGSLKRFSQRFLLIVQPTDLITCMSFKFFIELIEGYPVPFALNYSFGNILSLMSSCFLCGPRKQFKNLFDERRKHTSITYLSCLAATLVVVFLPIQWTLQLFILICLLITQCLASFWYSLSYVPYGRRTVKRFVYRYLGLNESQPLEGQVG